jgi:hypothetical protein
MARGGTGEWTSTDHAGNVTRGATFTCAHQGASGCLGVVEVTRDSEVHMCGVEHRRICGPCAARGKCAPLEERLAKIEARDRFLRSAGIRER